MGLWCLLRDSQPHTSWHKTAGAVFLLQAGRWGTKMGLQNGRGLSAPHVWGHNWETRMAGSAWNVWSRTTRAGDLETEAQSWRSRTPELRARHRAAVIAVWSWQKTRHVHSWGQAVSPAMSPHICGKAARRTRWGKDCFFNKERKWRHRWREQRHDCQGAGEGAWESGLDRHTTVMLCLEPLSDEDLPCPRGELGSALWWPTWEGNPKKMEICVCSGSTRGTAEADPTLQSKYTPKMQKRKGSWKTAYPDAKQWNGALILPYRQKLGWIKELNKRLEVINL